jgi:hypothetical protein
MLQEFFTFLRVHHVPLHPSFCRPDIVMLVRIDVTHSVRESSQSYTATYSQSVSQSFRPSFEPLTGTHGHILAVEEYLCIFCHVKGSLSLCHVYLYFLYTFSFLCLYISLFSSLIFIIYYFYEGKAVPVL